MSYKRSILIGVCIVSIVILLSVLTFYYSEGSCINGTFPCGPENNRRCVPQHLICGRTDTCRDEYKALCGLYFGSVDFMGSIINSTLNNATTIDYEGDLCLLEWFPDYCFCVNKTGLLCGWANFTRIPEIPPDVTFLYLEGNNIRLTDDSLNGLNLTHRLDLGENNISELPSKIFHSQIHLEQLFLRRNQIEEVPHGLFHGMTSLKWLMMQENQLQTIPLTELTGLTSLKWLNLKNNQLRLDGERFPVLPSITEIDLSFNAIETIDKELFSKLDKLNFLSLSNNYISYIHPSAFNGLINLQELRLASNKLTYIDARYFYPLKALDALFIGNNNLVINDTILRSVNISYLNLDGIKFDSIDFKAIANAQHIEAIFFTRFYFCSMTPNIKNCIPSSDGVSTIKDLLSKPTLRYSTWSMAMVTCLGNSLVLWGRFTQRDENRAVSMVIRNLAISDMLMGFYLGIIGIQDYRYREQYHNISSKWATSWSCTAIGVMAMVSSEVSLLILTFISIERFLLIADPFGGHRRLTTHNVFLCLFTIWLIGITIAIIPVIHWRNSTHFYGTYSGTCFPLHLQERFQIGWEYSAIVFMGINMFLLILIGILYTALLISIWRTRKQTPLGVLDCEFAIRFFFIVLVDTFCWAPIIAMKTFVFFSYEISADVYAFLVVFVLPLNSAVNPILYTFTTPKYRNQVLLRGWNKLTSRKFVRHDGSGHTGSGHTGSGSNHGRSLNSNLSRSRRTQPDEDHCS